MFVPTYIHIHSKELEKSWFRFDDFPSPWLECPFGTPKKNYQLCREIGSCVHYCGGKKRRCFSMLAFGINNKIHRTKMAKYRVFFGEKIKNQMWNFILFFRKPLKAYTFISLTCRALYRNRNQSRRPLGKWVFQRISLQRYAKHQQEKDL